MIRIPSGKDADGNALFVERGTEAPVSKINIEDANFHPPETVHNPDHVAVEQERAEHIKSVLQAKQDQLRDEVNER
jgi:hypothetical protein